jgi:hypothetical protein
MNTFEDGAVAELADRYMELMSFRNEAFAKFGGDALSAFAGPRAKILFPTVARSKDEVLMKRLGPLGFVDRQPVVPFVDAILRASRTPLTILEIGPGSGALARYLIRRFGSVIERYVAVDRDSSVSGPFDLYASVEDVPYKVDLVIAAEVIEHMTVDNFYRHILSPLQMRLSKDARLVITTPNPLAPGGIARDITHVQRYPWYDLHAVLRLAFSEVEIYRTHYIFSYRRLLQFPLRVLLCTLLEFEWCEGLTAVATGARSS